jgi:DNA primase
VPDDFQRDALLAALLVAPSLVPEFADRVEAVGFADPHRSALRAAILRHAEADDVRGALAREVGPDSVQAFLGAAHVRIMPAVRSPSDLDLARKSVLDAIDLLSGRASHEAIVSEVMADMADADGEWATSQLRHAAAAVDVTRRKESEDTREVVLAPNGLALDKDERERADRLLGAIDFTRGGRGRRS